MYSKNIIKIVSLGVLTVLVSACEPALHSKSSIKERYSYNRDGTITDTLTNLTWMRCSLGQKWTGSTCVGEAAEMSWSEAINAAESFAHGGFSNWRIPLVEELDSLVQCPIGRKPSVRPDGHYVEDTDGRCHGSEYIKAKINNNAFPNTPADWFWSSSPNTNHPNFVWYVGFNHGIVGNSHKNSNSKSRARLVRSGD